MVGLLNVNSNPTSVAGFVDREVKAANTPNEKRPLYRPLPPAAIFPDWALGPLSAPAHAIQQKTKAPFAIAAQSVLAAATLAVQPHRNVMLPGGGEKPLTGLYLSIAESGERKSSVDKLALKPILEVEAQWREERKGLMASYRNANDAWEAARAAVKRKHKGNMEPMKKELAELGHEPKEPPHAMLLVSDPTPEGLTMHLANGRPFVGVFTAEGGLLFGGAGFSEESRMRTTALFNSLWDGEAIRRRRVGTGETFLLGKRCSMHVMVQPIVADELFSEALYEGMGLTARMLVVAPNSTAGTRFFSEAPKEAGKALEDYYQRIRNLLQRPPVTKSDAPDILNPLVMRLCDAAKSEWIVFHDECESMVIGGEYLAPIRGFAAKLAEHAGRLATILTVYLNPDALEVPLEAMRCGIGLAKHYAEEMLRLHAHASVNPDIRPAQKLLDWWQRQSDKSIHLAQIYQKGPGCLRDAKSARKAAHILEEHGQIALLDPGIILDGAPRKEAWRLVP